MSHNEEERKKKKLLEKKDKGSKEHENVKKFNIDLLK